ncbi:MAG TPA: hypothetical protein VFY43_04340 [Candidatus Limnocylindria bacterium]|nr:hypothetical protein [Candidatus Limnocylindria bacterium]
MPMQHPQQQQGPSHGTPAGTLVLRAAVFVCVVGAAALIGLGLGLASIRAWEAIRGPFQPEWDDTWRERLPAALAYLIWTLTTIAGVIVGSRLVMRLTGRR